jgi:predicted phosphate transport protein (TIGR00153 family)
MGFFNFLPKEEQYFAFFSQMTSFICEAARALSEMLSDESGNYEEHARRIKAIENQCDELAHKVSTRLNKSFITPFDREDIYLMSSALDDIVDLIDDAARAMVMYGVNESTQHARNFADVLVRMSVELHDIVSRLERPDGIAPKLVTLHTLENEGDEIYHRAIKELFHNAQDPLHVMKWNSIYEKLEAAIDRCENVANIIESVIIKHT